MKSLGSESPRAKASPTKAVIRVTINTGGARLVTAGMSLATVPLLISALGVHSYGVYATIVSLSAFLVFADQGLAVSARTQTAQRLAVSDYDGAMSDIRATARLMRRMIAVLLLAVCCIAVLGPWPTILGTSDGRWLVAAYLVPVTLLLAATVPLRALEGVGQSAYVALLPVLGSAWLLSSSVAGFFLKLELAYFLVTAGSINLLAFAAARWRLRRVLYRRTSGAVDRVGSMRDAWLATWPMAVVSVMLSISYSLDPLVISTVIGPADTAAYAVAAKLYQPALALLLAGVPVLWSHFAAMRVREKIRFDDLVRQTIPFALGACCVGGLLTLLGPPLTRVWTSGQVGDTLGIFIAFAALLVVTCCQVVPGTAMTDRRSLRFQAVTTTLMAGLNVPLSIWLAHVCGAQGPIWASTLTLAACHALPLWIRAWQWSR